MLLGSKKKERESMLRILLFCHEFDQIICFKCNNGCIKFHYFLIPDELNFIFVRGGGSDITLYKLLFLILSGNLKYTEL